MPVLCANPSTRHIPSVLLTSQLSPRAHTRFQHMAIDGVIAKPFDPVTMGRQIAALLGWPEAKASRDVTTPGHPDFRHLDG